MRDGEVNGNDYFFITEKEFDENYESFFETVEFQFFPDRYGGEATQLDADKTNVLVVSIEGFLSAIKNLKNYHNEHILVNIINDDKLDVDRDGRDPRQEENYNLSVLHQFYYNYKGFEITNYLNIFDEKICYVELPLSKLKEFRNKKKECLKFFNSLIKEKE